MSELPPPVHSSMAPSELAAEQLRAQTAEERAIREHFLYITTGTTLEVTSSSLPDNLHMPRAATKEPLPLWVRRICFERAATSEAYTETIDTLQEWFDAHVLTVTRPVTPSVGCFLNPARTQVLDWAPQLRELFSSRELRYIAAAYQLTNVLYYTTPYAPRAMFGAGKNQTLALAFKRFFETPFDTFEDSIQPNEAEDFEFTEEEKEAIIQRFRDAFRRY